MLPAVCNHYSSTNPTGYRPTACKQQALLNMYIVSAYRQMCKSFLQYHKNVPIYLCSGIAATKQHPCLSMHLTALVAALSFEVAQRNDLP